MYALRTKKAMIKYAQGYKIPQELITSNHPAIRFDGASDRYVWTEGYLLGMSMDSLESLAGYLEQLEGVSN